MGMNVDIVVDALLVKDELVNSFISEDILGYSFVPCPIESISCPDKHINSAIPNC